jgi:sensor histidine kinase YesM
MPDHARRMPPWLVAAGLAAFALFMSLVEVAQVYLRSTIGGPQIQWVDAVFGGLPSWLLLALLAPLPFVLARRWPLDRAPRGRAVGVHLAGVAAFVIGHSLSVAGVMAIRFGVRAPLATAFTKVLSFSSVVDLLTYAVIVGAAHALRLQTEARERERQAAALRESLADARLAGLRAQVNPHMLFNALNAVSVLAMKGDRDGVVKVVGLLSDILRASLDETRGHAALLSDELRLVESYLEIQRVRFADRLSVQVDVPPDVLAARVPTMVLSPLVENAVTHGLSHAPGPGRIAIRAAREGNTLRLSVEDSGPGFGSSPHRGGGVGLSSVRARLELLYGASHELATGTSALGGASVIIAIPYQER